MGDIPGYRIMNELGRGGMARVYLALHEGLDRLVAVKVLCPNLAADSSFSERFIREARIVASLSHPNIITVYDVGVHKSQHYIAMEYLPGETLKSKIKQKMNPEKALRYMKQMSMGLKAAHDKGFIHRDIKPANILFRENGSPVITDFGVARAEKSDTQMTQAGTIIGTPHYMSPEQAQGLPLKANADLYSLGVVFYEMLVGEVPYKSDSMVAIIYKHVHEPVPELPEHLSMYQTIINRLLAKNVIDRYQSGDEIISDIDAVEFTHRPELATRIMPKRTANKSHENVLMILRLWGRFEDKAALFFKSVNYYWEKIESTNKKTIVLSGVSFVVVFFIAINMVFTIKNIGTDTLDDVRLNKLEIFSEKQQPDNTYDFEKTERSAYESEQNIENKIEDESIHHEEINSEQREQERLALIKKEQEKQLALKLREKNIEKIVAFEKINKLISKAELQIRKNRLNDAYSTYQKVKLLDNNNSDAENGIKQVADKYLNLALTKAKNNQFSKARVYLNKANKIFPHHPEYSVTGQRVSTLESRYKRQREEDQMVKLEQKRQKAKKEEAEKSSLQRHSFGGF